MHIQRYFLAIVATLSLHGCSLFETKESPAASENQHWQNLQQHLNDLNQWQIIGKVNIRTPEDSVTAAINSWEQADERYEINLSSTFLGLGATTISGNNYYVVLKESGEDPLVSDQPEALIESALGIPLPINSLTSWIKGLPSPDSQHKIEYDLSGLVKSLEQNNWRIEYSRYNYENKIPLPAKLKLYRDETKITLAIKQWTLP